MEKLTNEKAKIIDKINQNVEILNETFVKYGLKVDAIGSNISNYLERIHFFADIIVEDRNKYPKDDGIMLYITVYDENENILGRYEEYIEDNIDEYNDFFTINVEFVNIGKDEITKITKIKFYCNRYI